MWDFSYTEILLLNIFGGQHMSNQVERFKHSKRLQKKIRAIKKQTRIAQSHGFPTGPEHRLSKVHATTCGDSHCAMCGNPRKFFKERTIQERSFEQTKKWTDE
jgi:hypothetical protein